MNRQEDTGLSLAGHGGRHSGPWTGVHRLLGHHMLLSGRGCPLHGGNPWSPGDARGRGWRLESWGLGQVGFITPIPAPACSAHLDTTEHPCH